MLIAAGVAAVFGLFLPFIHITRGPVSIGFNAKDLTFGMAKTRAVVEKQLPGFTQKPLPNVAEHQISRVRDAQEDLHTALDYSKYAAYAFLPGLILGLLGGIALWRKRAGRLLGLMALPFGIVSVGAWFGLRYAIVYAVEEADISKLEVTMQLGGHALLVIGVLGVVAGFGALLQPDAKVQAAAPSQLT